MAESNWRAVLIGAGVGLGVFIVGGLFAVAMTKSVLGGDLLALAVALL